MLEGKKVRLRPTELKDSKKFIAWNNNPSIDKYFLNSLELTTIVEEKSKKDVLFIIEILDTAKPVAIGCTGLHQIDWIDHCATFAIIIENPSHWKKGYGTEAAHLLIRYGFEIFNFDYITSNVFACNKRSIALHKKVGFDIKEVRQKAIHKNGSLQDIIIFALSRKSYQAQK
ncbi:MAG: GNAT family protein [Patescibacteria group bacterium]